MKLLKFLLITVFTVFTLPVSSNETENILDLSKDNSCWTYGQNQKECLTHSECQWCDKGGILGTFCAPPGENNCLASSFPLQQTDFCSNLKELDCRSHYDKCNWTGPLGGCMNRWLDALNFDCTNFNEQMCVAHTDKCIWIDAYIGCWDRSLNSPNMDCTNFSEQMCSQNFQWCNWGGPLEGCMNRYRQSSSEAFQSSEIISNLENTGKCLEELKAIVECGDNAICLSIKTAEIIGECVSVVCPHVPWWAQGAACLVYCANNKEQCNRGLTSIDFVDMSNFYELSSNRQCLMVGAKALYDQRSNEIYTGDVNKRWDGIFDNVMPPSAPKYSDCSSAVSWIYWTCFKDGSDFINGEDWNDGYTGTLDQHGHQISLSNAQPGDLVFYGNPVDHVAIYIGSGRVISHGSDPVCNCDVHYRSDLNQVRSYLSSNGLIEEVNCDNLNRQQCLEHPKECIYIGCSYGCPGCMFRNETTENMYDKALEQGVIPVDYDWKHSAFACCPAAIKDGLECGLDPLCILYAIIKNKCPQKCEADLCHNVPSTCRRSELDMLGSIQSEIQHSTSDYWGHDTSAGPDGGVEACAWAVNNIMSMSGLRKIGDNPNYVPSVVDALKGGRGRQIQASQAVAGDLVVACGEQHIGVCMEDHCNTIDSNSSSRRCFCWRAGFNFDNYFNCGPATYWRVDN